ncbi:MAG TPA: TCP-1/cpn60 chaperonin family protein [Anaerolineales bacterium]|nr:TCP-1/cpn60 chaperonin family protein [Anaerolineales bacterium]
MHKPGVIFSPQSVSNLVVGLDQLADLLSLTLGPTQGSVLSSTELKPKPELLTSAAVIARRMTSLPEPAQDVGAMLLRNMVWRVHQRVGDGGALTAVLTQSLIHRTLRCLSAGAQASEVMHGVRLAAQKALDQLDQLSQQAQGESDLAAVALSVTGDEKLSFVLGEMMELLGPQAYVIIEDYMAPYLERVYLDGGRWEGSLISPYMVNAPQSGKAILQDCLVVLYDSGLQQAEQLSSVIEKASTSASKHLLLVAQQISGEALTYLAGVNQQSDLKIIAVGLKRSGEHARTDFRDLALLSGAEIISPIMGRQLSGFRQEDFGFAKRVEASKEELLVAGGKGSPLSIRQEIEVLQARLRALPFSDDGRAELQLRIGRLSGNAGILKIGALTQPERDYLHQKAEQGLKVLQATVEEGVLPGGGTAFLHCIPALEPLLVGAKEDESMGIKAMMAALQAPARQIMTNAGVSAPSVIIADLMQSEPGMVYDVTREVFAQAREAGMLDSTRVLRVVLETAVSGAMMALSTDTIVLKRKPKVSYEP